MKFIIRMYRTFDLDLINLYKNPKFDFSNAIADAVRASARNEQLFIKLPLNEEVDVVKVSKCTTHMYLDDKEDEDVIKWLMGIEEGYRNTVIKNILRSHFLSVYYEPYVKKDDKRTETAIDMSGYKNIQIDYKTRGHYSQNKRQVVNAKPINGIEKNLKNKNKSDKVIDEPETVPLSEDINKNVPKSELGNTDSLYSNSIVESSESKEPEEYDLFSQFEKIKDY